MPILAYFNATINNNFFKSEDDKLYRILEQWCQIVSGKLGSMVVLVGISY